MPRPELPYPEPALMQLYLRALDRWLTTRSVTAWKVMAAVLAELRERGVYKPLRGARNRRTVLSVLDPSDRP